MQLTLLCGYHALPHPVKLKAPVVKLRRGVYDDLPCTEALKPVGELGKLFAHCLILADAVSGDEFRYLALIRYGDLRRV